MGMGLEIYDEKGRLIIGSDQIIPRYLGYFQIPVSKNGSLAIPEIAYGGEILCEFSLRYFNNSGPGFWITERPNELSSWSINGTALTWYVDYNKYRWDGGGTTGDSQFSQHVMVWAV